METLTIKLSDELLQKIRDIATASGRTLEDEAERFLSNAIAREEGLKRDVAENRHRMAQAGITIDSTELQQYRSGSKG